MASIIEAVFETSVEESVTSAVETAVENAVEDVVEETVEESMENAVEETVENAVEDSVEESFAIAVEDTVGEAFGEAVTSTWKKQLLYFIAALIISVTVISPIIHAIKAATGAGKKDCDIDDKTKKKINRSEGVLDALNALLQSWTAELKKYGSKDSLGKITYGERNADAGGVVWTLFNDMKEDLKNALCIADEDKANCQWKANIDQFELDVIKGAYNVSAIFIAKDHAPVMQEKNFPPEADRKKMTDAFNKYYNDDWKKIIKNNAKKNLTKAVRDGAKKASEDAVKTLIKEPLKAQIKSGIQSKVAPEVKSEATDAAKAETAIVFNDWHSRIEKHLEVPVEGLATLKKWMLKNVKPEAVQKSKEKALAAANATMQLPPAQIKIMNISSDAKKQVLRQYKEQIKKTADQAASDYIKKVLAEKGAKK
ncbi:hypothetical protein ABFA07_018061 [Porites harrisoni]